MKALMLCAAFFVLLSCSKEKTVQAIPGTWTIVESNIGTGTAFNNQTYPPSSEITLEFGREGKLLLTGTNPGTAMSPLWEYDRYEIRQDNTIRFFQSTGAQEIEANYTMDGNLHLYYTWARCGYEERFVKIR